MKITLLQILFVFAVLPFASGTDFAQNRKFTTADLQKLRWIEGTWRGTGDVNKPFFERYRFAGDSVLVVESFADETLQKITETTRFELKDGEFGGGSDGARYVAQWITDKGVEFGPALKVSNSFRWELESKDVWKATILLPAKENKPARQMVYKMERVK